MNLLLPLSAFFTLGIMVFLSKSLTPWLSLNKLCLMITPPHSFTPYPTPPPSSPLGHSFFISNSFFKISTWAPVLGSVFEGDPQCIVKDVSGGNLLPLFTFVDLFYFICVSVLLTRMSGPPCACLVRGKRRRPCIKLDTISKF